MCKVQLKNARLRPFALFMARKGLMNNTENLPTENLTTES